MHQAIRSGMLAAELVSEQGSNLGFVARWRASIGHREMQAVRNFKPALRFGSYFAMINSGLEALLKGRTSWTLRDCADWSALAKRDTCDSPERGRVNRGLPQRDRVSSVFVAGSDHDEVQSIHCKVADI